jgi:hypothetical protein
MLMALRATSEDENLAQFDKRRKTEETAAKKRNGRNLILVDRPESKLVWPT